MPEIINTSTAVEKPLLWNPNAAANWSLLFSPAFGAFLHARNAEALGRTQEAESNWIWFYISIYCHFFMNQILQHKHDTSIVYALISVIIYFLYWCFWYFSTAREQIKFVKTTLNNDYTKRSWLHPLFIAIFCGMLLNKICN